MKRHTRPSTIAIAALTALTLSGAAAAQTQVTPPKNKYKPQEDVQLGQQAAREVRQQLPMLDDDRTEEYVEDIGERLIDAIPGNLRHDEFRYSFDVVNLRDINAFALPGGPMFLNRGMIQAAGTEAEVAGVMAHELSHVVLRHGTAQVSAGQKYQIGAIAGQVLGAILGGRTGGAIAQGSQIGASLGIMKYGREYERQADLLGAQMMARAGYDPRAMARMFQTIERQGGNRGPEWMSSHPNPGNRVEAINREAEMLRVEGSRESHGDFASIRSRLSGMPQAPTTQEVAQRQGQGRREPVGTSGRSVRVEPPSGQWRTHQPGDFMRLSVPGNWQQMGGDSGTVTYAPEGGYGSGAGFTHGLQVGVARGGNGSLEQQTEELIQGFAQSNPNLRSQGRYSRTTIDGRSGLTMTLSNRSDATGESEMVDVSTVQLEDGNLLFLLGVAPADEARTYRNVFNRVRQSVQLADR